MYKWDYDAWLQSDTDWEKFHSRFGVEEEKEDDEEDELAEEE